MESCIIFLNIFYDSCWWIRWTAAWNSLGIQFGEKKEMRYKQIPLWCHSFHMQYYPRGVETWQDLKFNLNLSWFLKKQFYIHCTHKTMCKLAHTFTFFVRTASLVVCIFLSVQKNFYRDNYCNFFSLFPKVMLILTLFDSHHFCVL